MVVSLHLPVCSNVDADSNCRRSTDCSLRRRAISLGSASMRLTALFVVLAVVGACEAPESVAMQPDAAGEASADAALDSPVAHGFGELSGMCGVLNAPELTGDQPALVRARLTFARRYNDPEDRPLLT